MSRSNRSFTIAAAALAGSAALFAWVLANALETDPVHTPAPSPASQEEASPASQPTSPADAESPPSVEAPRARQNPDETTRPGEKGSSERFASSDALSGEALAMMVNQDPFSPTRAAAEPYRLPGEEVEAAPEPPREPPPPQFRLHGTVLTPSGGIALLELENTQRIVSVGESVQGYRLAGVDAQTATVEANGRLITYRVSDPMPRRPARNTNTRNAPAGNAAQSAQERAQAQRQLQLRQELLRGALQQLQQMGDASPEVQARIMELMRGMGVTGGGAERVIRAPGYVPLQSRDVQIRLNADSARRRPGGR